MRFLNTTTLQFHIVPDTKLNHLESGYAILSHRWRPEEVSFQDIEQGSDFSHKHGSAKLRGACKIARQHGFDFMWADTCCIDQRSILEVSEAINSSYRWYENAKLCLAYLEDVDQMTERDAVTCSEWFERGWTLQELIAPRRLEFYDREWSLIGTKQELIDVIALATKIPTHVLQNIDPPHSYSVAQRMSWAAGRKTERVEDIAYSLFGIFNVNLPLIYGEQEGAFVRLQQEIIKTSVDESIFAWNWSRTDPVFESSPKSCVPVFAPSPAYFADSGNLTVLRETSGFAIDQFGLRAIFDAALHSPGTFEIHLRVGRWRTESKLEELSNERYVIHLARLPNSPSYVRFASSGARDGLRDDYSHLAREVTFSIKLHASQMHNGNLPVLFTRNIQDFSFMLESSRDRMGGRVTRTNLTGSLTTFDRPAEMTLRLPQQEMFAREKTDVALHRMWLKIVFHPAFMSDYNGCDWHFLVLGYDTETLQPVCALYKIRDRYWFRMVKNDLGVFATCFWNNTWRSWKNHLAEVGDYSSSSVFRPDGAQIFETGYRGKNARGLKWWNLVISMMATEVRQILPSSISSSPPRSATTKKLAYTAKVCLSEFRQSIMVRTCNVLERLC